MDLSSLSRGLLLIGALLFVLLAIIAPISAFAAQKYAHLCYQELKKLNGTISSNKSSISTKGTSPSV